MPRSGRRPVAYFHGCAANYLEDGVGDAVIELLREQGMEPDLPPQRCSGTPIETYGHRNLVMEGARSNMASLAPYDVVVTGCASCTLMLKDYPSLFEPGVERDQAEQLAARVRHISEVLDESGGEGGSRSKSMPAAASPPSLKVTYHSSCHLRAAGVTKAPRQVLQALPGRTYVEMQDADRCAGGAGTYILKDYDTAQKIFARKRRAIEESGAHIVATSCPACMIQLKNGLRDKVEVKHVAQAILDARRSHVSDQA
jgi:Fe-S oxidoreductase